MLYSFFYVYLVLLQYILCVISLDFENLSCCVAFSGMYFSVTSDVYCQKVFNLYVILASCEMLWYAVDSSLYKHYTIVLNQLIMKYE